MALMGLVAEQHKEVSSSLRAYSDYQELICNHLTYCLHLYKREGRRGNTGFMLRVIIHY